MSLTQSAEKRVVVTRDWFWVYSDWMKKSASFLSQSGSLVMKNQSRFDTGAKTAVKRSVV